MAARIGVQMSLWQAAVGVAIGGGWREGIGFVWGCVFEERQKSVGSGKEGEERDGFVLRCNLEEYD